MVIVGRSAAGSRLLASRLGYGWCGVAKRDQLAGRPQCAVTQLLRRRRHRVLGRVGREMRLRWSFPSSSCQRDATDVPNSKYCPARELVTRFQTVDTVLRQIVTLSSWLQSGHRKMRISEPPPGIGTIEIRCISTLQRQSGNSVEPSASTRSNFDMTRVGGGQPTSNGSRNFSLYRPDLK